jgi:hypothetical protein
MAYKVKCTPCFQVGRHVSRHKLTLYPGVRMACNAPTCGYPDWPFTDFTVTPIWRACRYRKFPQRSGTHPKMVRKGWEREEKAEKTRQRLLIKPA